MKSRMIPLSLAAVMATLVLAPAAHAETTSSRNIMPDKYRPAPTAAPVPGETLSYTQDNVTMVIPARSVSGDGFSFLAPTGAYRISGRDAVTVRSIDGNATMRVERLTNTTPREAVDQAKAALQASGYNQTSNNMNARTGNAPYQVVATGSGIKANVYILSAGADVVMVTQSYTTDVFSAHRPVFDAARQTLSIRSSGKPAPVPTPTTRPIGGDPRTWSPTTELRYTVGRVTHVAAADKVISDNGYVLYMLSGDYSYASNAGIDVYTRDDRTTFLTVYRAGTSMGRTSDGIISGLEAQDYTYRSSDSTTSPEGRVLTFVKGNSTVRVTLTAGNDGGTFVLRESSRRGDEAARAEMKAMIETFKQY